MTDRLPIPDWPSFSEDLMSNFDHVIEDDVADLLRKNEMLADYPGWNFHAVCWFADGQFHAAVHQYHEHVQTMSADSPRELMEVVCDEYGSQ